VETASVAWGAVSAESETSPPGLAHATARESIQECFAADGNVTAGLFTELSLFTDRLIRNKNHTSSQTEAEGVSWRARGEPKWKVLLDLFHTEK